MRVNAEELISRLNAKTQSYSPSVQGSHTTLDPSHVAGAIGLIKAPEGAKYMARVRYAGQVELAGKASYELFSIFNRKYEGLKQKRSYRSGLFTDMACMAIHEYTTAEICKTCNGGGSGFIDHRKVSCPDCYGLGVRLGVTQARAANLGIPRSTWHKSGWARIYGEMLDLLAKWDAVVCANLRL